MGERLRIDDALLSAVAQRLTDRDRAICRSLHEHRVLTAPQLCELHFDSIERARKRLTQLHQVRVLERFRPYRQYGSSPYHYVLDRLGAEIVASERGLLSSDHGWSRASNLQLATSIQLRHLTETNGFFTCLARALRRRHDAALIEWRSQRRCAGAWGEVIRPDGYLRLRLAGALLEAWLEWDRATEQHARLADKLDRYEELAVVLERPVNLLLVAPSDERERHIRQRLRRCDEVAVLTTTAARHGADPLGRNWLAAAAEGRHSLAEHAHDLAVTCSARGVQA
jgi:protein involved in plasmid replication-relaxation